MTINGGFSRRQFLSGSGTLAIGEALLSIAPASAAADTGQLEPGTIGAIAKSQMKISNFLFGASVYPELQTRAEWNSMLDHFERAHITCVRVTESSWGNIETASGKYEFGWVRNFLDDLEKREMKAFLGTGSYVPPQWLAAGSPEILSQLHPGVKAHPMARHAPCWNHPLYRQALHDYILALVFVGESGAEKPHYLMKPFDQEPDFATASVNFKLAELLKQSGANRE